MFALFAALIWTRERLSVSFLVSFTSCLAGLALRLALGDHLARAPFLTFIPAVVLAALAGGLWPGLAAIAISAVLADYFFIPPAGVGLFWPQGWTLILVFVLISTTMVVMVNWAVASNIRLNEALRLLRAVNESLEVRVAAGTAELLSAEAQLRQSQKMEAVGQLTGGIAHDFNNMLTSIAGSLEILQTRLVQNRYDDLPRYVAAARDAADRAAHLTHRLLAFSRRQGLAPRPINLNHLVAGMEELIRGSIGPAISLQYLPTEPLGSVFVDPNQLEQALLNLCINASDAMPQGGVLAVKTTHDRSRGHVCLTVRDSGHGMTPDIMERVFEPFFTTKPAGQGTGLGLSMIYGFVHQSGGDIALESVPGQGTSVTLRFPVHDGPLEEPAADQAVAAQPDIQAGRTVLMVDDEPSLRMLAKDVLEELGHICLCAADATGAMQHLQSPAQIDLLVADIGLPGAMGGSQLAQAARALRPNLRLLFITGYGNGPALGQGANAIDAPVLPKPFSMAAFARKVQDLLAPAEP